MVTNDWCINLNLSHIAKLSSVKLTKFLIRDKNTGVYYIQSNGIQKNID